MVIYRLPFPTGRHVSIEEDCELKKTFDSREGNVQLISHKRTGVLRIIKTVQHWNSHDLPAEAKALALLPMVGNKRHENIIKLLQCEHDPRQGGAIMMFEHCSGGDLFDQVTRRTANPLFALHIFISLAEALAFIHHGLVYEGRGSYRKVPHHKPILHGDVKEDNCFIRWGKETTGGALPSIVLADFGMTKRPHESFAGVGCLQYMSPEASSGRGKLTTATDIYSFGVMFHRILNHTATALGRISNP